MVNLVFVDPPGLPLFLLFYDSFTRPPAVADSQEFYLVHTNASRPKL